MLTLRLLNPKYVVEQEIIVIRWSQSFEAEVRPMNDHLPELSNLGMNAKRGHFVTLLMRANGQRAYLI